MVEFGEQLRRAREEKGMTQQTLAEKLFVTRQSVSHWECGVRFPDLPTTKKISEILDVSLDDLLSGEDMNEVVERNPVIEKKWANNILIMLYAFIVVSFLILILDELTTNIIAISTGTREPALNGTSTVIEISGQIRNVLYMIIFAYGLVHALKGTLSPKRVGAVIVSFFSLELLYLNVGYISLFIECPSLWDHAHILEPFVLIPLVNISGYLIIVLSAFFFFIRNSKRIIWMILLCAFFAIRIITTVWGYLGTFSLRMGTSTDMFWEQDCSDTHLIVSSLFQIILFGLFIYQTITLYKKRKNVAEVIA
ncbi:MAG: helix-turn-helix domain-containing protein [Butyrivibrio sp.]|nr:helix-turn-helix domain-containing protein [Butyrivibrio sp.]